jgi:hypothetical protein
MRRWVRSCAAVILIAAVTPGAAPAQGQTATETPATKGSDSDEAEARRIFRRGQAHYNLNEYAQAADDFEGAYRLFPHPVFLYNAAQAHRLAGNDERALYFYRVYLRVEPKSKMRAEVQERIAALEKAVQGGTPASAAPTSPRPTAPGPAPASPPPVSPSPRTPVTPPPAAPAPSSQPASPAPASPPATSPPASAAPASGTAGVSPSGTTSTPASGAPAGGTAPATPGEGSADTSSSSPAVTAHASEKTPVYKKWWLWTIVGVVVVGVAVGAGVGATAGGSNSPPAIRF